MIQHNNKVSVANTEQSANLSVVDLIASIWRARFWGLSFAVIAPAVLWITSSFGLFSKTVISLPFIAVTTGRIVPENVESFLNQTLADHEFQKILKSEMTPDDQINFGKILTQNFIAKYDGIFSLSSTYSSSKLPPESFWIPLGNAYDLALAKWTETARERFESKQNTPEGEMLAKSIAKVYERRADKTQNAQMKMDELLKSAYQSAGLVFEQPIYRGENLPQFYFGSLLKIKTKLKPESFESTRQLLVSHIGAFETETMRYDGTLREMINTMSKVASLEVSKLDDNFQPLPKLVFDRKSFEVNRNLYVISSKPSIVTAVWLGVIFIAFSLGIFTWYVVQFFKDNWQAIKAKSHA